MTKVKKNKMKTHKGTKKVLNIRKSGSISVTHQGGLHNTGKQTAKRTTHRERQRDWRIQNTNKRILWD